MNVTGFLLTNESKKEQRKYSENDKNKNQKSNQKTNESYRIKLKNKLSEPKKNSLTFFDKKFEFKIPDEKKLLDKLETNNKIKEGVKIQEKKLSSKDIAKKLEFHEINILETLTYKPSRYENKINDTAKYQKKLNFEIFKNIKKDQFNFDFNQMKIQEGKFLKQSKNLNIYLNKRNKLISIIREIHQNLNFNKESFYLAVYYLDIILNKLCKDYETNFETFNLTNLSISCLLLSSKFSENDPSIPNVKDYLSEKISNYSNHSMSSIIELKEFEVKSIIQLDYKLNYSCPFHFLKLYFTIGFIFKEDFEVFSFICNLKTKNTKCKKTPEIDLIMSTIFYEYVEQTYKKCDELMYLVIQDNQILFGKNELNSIHVASAIIYIGREFLYEKIDEEKFIEKDLKIKYDIWDINLEKFYGVRYEEFKDEYKKIKKIKESINIPKKTFEQVVKTDKKHEFKLDNDKYDDPYFYTIKNNNRPLSTSNSKFNNFLIFKKTEDFYENIMTLPNKYEESPKKSSYGNLGELKLQGKLDKKKELNLHLNYDSIDKKNFEEANEIKKLVEKNDLEIEVNSHDYNIDQEINFNNFKVCQEKIPLTKKTELDIEYEKEKIDIDLKEKKISFENFSKLKEDFSPKNSKNKIIIKNELISSKGQELIKLKSANDIIPNRSKNNLKEIQKMKESFDNKKSYHLRNSSNLRKSTDSKNKLLDSDNTVMEKNTIENPKNSLNRDLSNDIKKLLDNNNQDFNKLNLEEIKKIIHSKKDLEELKKKFAKDKTNKEDINFIIKELFEKKSNKQDKYTRNIQTKENEQFYTKLNDYKIKQFSDRSHNSKPAEEKNVYKSNRASHNLKSKNFLTNNTYEDNLRSSNEFHYNNEFYKDYNKQNKNLLDKTKKLLNKNSFEFLYDNSHYVDEDKILNKNLSNEKINRLYENDITKNQRMNKDVKNSMIIINNNININTYINNNDYKKDFNNRNFDEEYERKMMYQKYEKNSEYKKISNRKEIDYNYNFYSRNEENKYLPEKFNEEIIKRKNLYNDLRQNHKYENQVLFEKVTNDEKSMNYMINDNKYDNYKKYDYYDNYNKKYEEKHKDEIYPKNVIIKRNYNEEKFYKKYDYLNNLGYSDDNFIKY